MKKRNILRLILLVIFLVSTALLLLQFRDNAGGSNSYDSALAIATANTKKETAPPEKTEEAETKPEWVPEEITDDPHMEEMAQIDLAALKEVNPDVIGWIRIPDSNIDYPILQGEDNDFYLHHTWDKVKNSVGSVFMEHRNTPDFTDYNTILYAHNMNDGSMFANVKRYNTLWYWERHRYVYIATEEGVLRYEIFSGYETKTESTTYGLSFQQTETKIKFLTYALEKSTANMEIVPELTDRILTLSTCSGLGRYNRWVIHARLKMVPTETAS